MKSKSVKRFLVATLAATMMMTSALTVAATGENEETGQVEDSSDDETTNPGDDDEDDETTNPGGDDEDDETTNPGDEDDEENPKKPSTVSGNTTKKSSKSSDDSSSESYSDSGSYEEPAPINTMSNLQLQSTNAKVTVAGTAIQSTVAGAVAVNTVQGVAVTTSAADVRANLGLTGNQNAYIMVVDTDAKKSYLAAACVDAAAAALGGTTVATLNVDMAAKENGRLITLSTGSVAVVVGLPKGADTSKTYSIVCVQPGGAVTILEDIDASPATVTFEVKAGLGTYGIIAR